MWYAYSAKGTGRRDWRLVAGPTPHLQLIPWFPQSIQESPQVSNHHIYCSFPSVICMICLGVE